MQFKKIIYCLSFFTFFFLTTFSVDAATLNVKLTSSANRLVVGNTVTYTVTVSSSELLGGYTYNFSYDSSKLQLTSGTLNKVAYFSGSEKSATYTFKFKAKASGKAEVRFTLNDAIDWNDQAFTYPKTTSKSINIITQAQLEASYSKNNYLSSLKVDNYAVSPAFHKNTLEYSLTVENDVRSINLSGSKEDAKASVTGLGTHSLTEGVNKLEVKVTAQNGSTRTYHLTVTVKELSPIVVEVEGKKLNVIRKKELLTAPNSKYVDTTIKIGEEEVPAFINDVTKVTLVGLKDEEGNSALYSYQEGTYRLYREFSFRNVILTENELTTVPKGYHKTTFSIGNQELVGYQKEGNVQFYLLYATNIETGVTSLYQYDSKEETIQLFDQKSLSEKEELEEKNKNYEYLIMGLGTLLAVTYIVILVSILKRRNSVSSKEKKKKEEVFIEEDDPAFGSDFVDDEDSNETETYQEEIKKILESDDTIEENISYKQEKKKRKKKK